MARRYQKGQLFLRGKNQDVWYGRFREDVQLPDGRVKRVNRNVRLGTIEEFSTKRLARRELDKHLEAINDLDYRPQSTITMRQFASTWKRDVLPNKKKSSAHTMASWTENHIIPFLGEYRLSEITPQMVQQFVNHMTAAGLKPRSVVTAYMTLRSIWRTAMLWGKVKHNVFPKKGIDLPQIKATDRKPFSEEETRQIIEAAPEPNRSLYWLMAETGLRVGEALALQMCDIDFVGGIVVVDKNFYRGNFDSPKTEGSNRSLALSPELLAHLHSRYATAAPADFLVAGQKPGKPLHYPAFHQRLQKLLDQLGIPRRAFHSFRYTNGTVSVAEGVDVKVLQERLGHSDPRTTLRLYARKVSAGERALAAKLGAKFAPKCTQAAVA